MSEMKTDIPCPVCGKKAVVIRDVILNIPYFGKTRETTLQCRECGYRHTDFMIEELREPMRFELLIEGTEDLNIRVVRSASGTISVPELGMKVEPGVASEGFISNIEGVLMRFRDAVEQAIHFSEGTAEEKASAERGGEILQSIDRVREGKEKVTVVIEDPFGNSAILSPKAKKRPLTDEEAKGLRTGMNIVDVVRGEEKG